MTKRMILTPRIKILSFRKSKWTPPEGQFASLNFLFINAVTTSKNLISIVTPNFPTFVLEERATPENLSKRKDIIVNAADKGVALVVSQANLYQKKALPQLSDTSFLLKSIKISLLVTNKLSRALFTTL